MGFSQFQIKEMGYPGLAREVLRDKNPPNSWAAGVSIWPFGMIRAEVYGHGHKSRPGPANCLFDLELV
jgi:hypothetical protein